MLLLFTVNAWLSSSILANRHFIRISNKFLKIVKWTWLLIFKFLLLIFFITKCSSTLKNKIKSKSKAISKYVDIICYGVLPLGNLKKKTHKVHINEVLNKN